MRKLLLSLAAALCVWASFAASGDDWGFYYQAQILDAKGEVITSGGKIVHKHTITLKLYTTPTGSTALWSGTFTVYCDDNGLFNVFVADSARAAGGSGSLEEVFRNNSEKLYVGLSVLTATSYTAEIKPRQRLASVPYAAYANAALGLMGESAIVTGDLQVSSNVVNTETLMTKSITVSKNLNVVGSIKIGDKFIEVVPVKGIILWDSDSPPSGTWNGAVSSDGYWHKCDGTGGTPNLQGVFPIGAGESYSVSSRGGAATVKLTKDNLPSHYHRFLGDDSYARVLRTINDKLARPNDYGDPDKIGDVEYFDKSKGKYKYKTWNVSDEGGTGDDWSEKYSHRALQEGTGAAGGKDESPNAEAEPHNNMPPYYVVEYIMRMK